MHEAKTQFSKLVARAEAGEEIVIGRAGKPVARLVALHASGSSVARPLGLLRGRITVHDDLDDPLAAELLAAFAGEGPIDPEPTPPAR